MNPFSILIHDLLNIVYPKHCPACGNVLVHQEDNLCIKCLYQMPKTRYHDDPLNPVCQIFWGRVPIQHATSLFFYSKDSHYQKVINHLKYKGKKEIGFELGKILGHILKETKYSEIDVIIPVPLHQKKQLKRGYNQSEWIAKGIAEAMNKPYVLNAVIRKVENETQTNRTRFQRWKNVENIFQVININTLIGKHVLLVDDIITTGATLEALAQKIHQLDRCKISIATLGMAN